MSVNYSVRFDIYDKNTLEYRASWSFPMKFPFLPVHRLAFQLHVRTKSIVIEECQDLQCGVHGHCSRYVNTNISFCYCDEGWSGKLCDIQHKCDCASGSICLPSFACLCPLEKFGPRCYVKHQKCPCKNGGVCVPDDERSINYRGVFCICADGYAGPTCEILNTKIEVYFAREMAIPLYILVHFIQVFGKQAPPKQATIFKQVRLDEDKATLHRTIPFHLGFVETNSKTYYLSYLQQNYVPSSMLSWTVSFSDHCSPIVELFNQTIVSMHILRRMKYYHIPCRERKNLACFYDERHMCICDRDRRQANCLEFYHNSTYNCEGRIICENG
ncbi:unnamed protein product, partial [Rotaria sp. Silwood2]